MLVAIFGWPIQRPSGWVNLSLLSERSVLKATPGVVSRPSGPCGEFNAVP
jgi:hypothetical protein